MKIAEEIEISDTLDEQGYAQINAGSDWDEGSGHVNREEAEILIEKLKSLFF